MPVTLKYLIYIGCGVGEHWLSENVMPANGVSGALYETLTKSSF